MRIRASRTLPALALALIVIGSPGVFADDSLAELRRLAQEESWQEAVAAAQRVVELDPRQGEAWLLLGQSLRNLERLDEAVAALERAVELEFQPARSNATLAITFAQAERPVEGLAALSAAVEAGLPASVVANHPALQSLRGTPGYPEVLAEAERLSHPCEHDDRYRALDFWIGDWEVFMGDQPVGRNRIRKLQRGCIVHESWTSASGGTGESINFFDPKTQKWTQHWVDENGGVVWYAGGPRGNGVHMVGENIDSEGKVKAARVTLTPNSDGTVHHLIEHSEDGGDTWMTWFDAVYRPAAESDGDSGE